MIKDEKFWDELEVFHMPDDYTNNTITFSMEEAVSYTHLDVYKRQVMLFRTAHSTGR